MSSKESCPSKRFVSERYDHFCVLFVPENGVCYINTFIVDGDWTTWTSWSECSVTCAGGNRTATRTCSDPAPAYGGADCEGKTEQMETCNTKPCHGKITLLDKDSSDKIDEISAW